MRGDPSASPADPDAARTDRPSNADSPTKRAATGRPFKPENPHRFQKGNRGRPKGIRNRRALIGLEAAKALEAHAWDVVEKLLGSSSWRARAEAAKLTLAYAIGLPRATLEITGAFGDLSRELSAALAEARVRRAAESTPAPVAALLSTALALPEAPAAPAAGADERAAQVPTTVSYPNPADAPGQAGAEAYTEGALPPEILR